MFSYFTSLGSWKTDYTHTLYLIGGQSNVGTNPATGRVPFAQLPVYLQSEMVNVKLWDNVDSFSESYNPPNVEWGWSNEFWYNASAGSDIYTVKFGQGGRQLAEGDSPYDSFDRALFKGYCLDALNNLKQIGNPQVIMLWNQGYTDALDEPNSLAYGNNLNSWFAEMRAHLNIPSMPIIYNRLSADVAPIYKNNVRAGQKANYSGNNTMINSDSFELQDVAHYSDLGSVDLGRSFYNVVSGLGVFAFSSYTVQSSKAIIEEYDNPNTWHGRPSIVEHKGNWAMAFIEGEEHSINGTQKIQIAFSEDKGNTWKAKNTFTDDAPVTGFVRQGNGTTADCTSDIQLVNSPNGDLLVIAGDKTGTPDPSYWVDTVVNSSSDGGKTWGSWVSIGSQIEGGGLDTWACLDHFVLGNTIYMAISYSPGGAVTTSAKSMVYKSIDYGYTWTKVGDISPLTDVTQEAGINVLNNGDFMAVVKADSTQSSGAAKYRSTDNGINWTHETDINNGIGIHQPLLKKYDRENRIYVTGRHAAGDWATGRKSGFTYSDDQGATWTQYFIPNLAKDLPDGGYADMVKISDDTFYLVCYEGVSTSDASLWEYVIKGII